MTDFTLPSEVYRLLECPDGMHYGDVVKHLLRLIEEKLLKGIEYYPPPDINSAKEFEKMIANKSNFITTENKKLILTLSKILNTSEVKASEVLNEYCKGKAIHAHESNVDSSCVDPISLVVEIRSFYFRQRLAILSTIRLLLVHEGDENYIYCNEIYEFAQKLPPSLLNSLVHLLEWNSSDWRDFEIGKKECNLDFSPRCTSLVKENHIVWSEQIISEFEILLEIAILLSKRHVRYLDVEGAQTPSSSFNSFDIQQLIYQGLHCGFGLPVFPSQRLVAISPPLSTALLHKTLDDTTMRVQYLWITFFISLCKFPYTIDCYRRHQVVKHPLVNVTSPCQLPSKELITYIDTLRQLDTVQDIEIYGQVNRTQCHPAALIMFILTYFLKIVVNNYNSNIDVDYSGIPLPVYEDVLVDVALDSLICSLYFVNNTYGTFYGLSDDIMSLSSPLLLLSSSSSTLSKRMRNHVLEVMRPFIFLLARGTDRDTGCFDENDPNRPLTPRIDLYSQLFQQVLQGTWNKSHDPDLSFLNSMLQAMCINTYRPVSLLRVLAAIVQHDYQSVIQLLSRPVDLSTIEPIISFPYSENDGKFIPHPNTSSHFIASKLRDCHAQIRWTQAEQVLVLWDCKVTNWILLIGTIVGNTGRDLEIWSEKGQCLVASLQVICKILQIDGGDKEVRQQCQEFINLSGTSIAGQNAFLLIIDPIITLIEHFAPILAVERSNEQHLHLFVTAIEFLLEMMKVVDNTADIVLGITSRFNYSETSLPERLYMIAMRNRNSLIGTFATITIIKLMSTLVHEMRMSPDSGRVNIKSIFDEIDEDGNGRISREELREGLQKLGYSVSQTTTDSLHARLDVRGTGSIYFTDLMNFATNVDEDGKKPATTEVELAMSELQAQLSDCFIPGGRAAFITSKQFGECSVDFAFSMLDAINYWVFDDQNLKKRIVLHIMNLFISILQGLPLYDFGYSFALHASAQIMRKIRDDSKNGLLLVQAALSVGLIAVHGGLKKEFNNGAEDSNKPMVLGMSTSSSAPKSKLNNNLLGCTYNTEKILPIDFTQVVMNELDYQVISCTLTVLDMLMEYIMHHDEECIPKFLGLFLSHADLPIGSILTNTGCFSSAQGSSHRIRLPCTYLAVLIGFITKSSIGPRSVAATDTLAARFVAKLLSCQPGSFLHKSSNGLTGAHASLLSTIGQENILHFATILCDLLTLRDGNVFTECEALRASAMDIFLSLATFHPDTLAHLIEQIPNTDVLGPCEEACKELKLSEETKNKIFESGEFPDDLVDLVTKKIQNQKNDTTPSIAPISSNSNGNTGRNRTMNMLLRERSHMKFLSSNNKMDNDDSPGRNNEHIALLPANSLIISKLFEELLSKPKEDESLYNSQPLIFFKITQLVLILFEKLPNTSIIGSLVHIFTSKLFWTAITEPLFDNLMKIEVESGEQVVIEYCRKVLCHSAVLELVTSERFGNSIHLLPPSKSWKKGVGFDVSKSGISIMLDEDPANIIQFIKPHLIRHRVDTNDKKEESTAGTAKATVAVDINGKSASMYPVKKEDTIEYCSLVADKTLDKILASFFEQAANSHRFAVWLYGASGGVDGAGLSYMDVDYDQDAIDDMKIKTERLGLQLRDLLTVSSSLSHHFANTESERWLQIGRFGSKYVFDSEAMFPIVDEMLWSDEEHDLVQTIMFNNLKLSKADAEMKLFKNWKKFLEIFILPSPMLAQKNIIAESPQSPSKGNSQGEGRFSPHIHGSGSNNPASPGSSAVSSSFEGDKRSYDALKCLTRQFRSLNSKRTVYAADLEIIHEKVEMFMNMLHHQLKEVVARTKDPSHANTSTRNSTNHRIDGNKISEFLTALDCAFSFYNTGASLVPSLVALSSQGSKANISRDVMTTQKSACNQTILSCVLLLISDSQFHLWTPEDISRKQAVTTIWMTHAVNALEAEMKYDGFYTLLEKSLLISSDGKRDRSGDTINLLSSEEESILKSTLTHFQILLQLIAQLIMSGSTGVTCADQLCVLIRNLFKSLSSYTSNYIQYYANYNHWPKINPVRVGESHLEAPAISTLDGNDTDLPVNVVELALRCMCDIMDLVTSCCDVQDGVLITTLISVGMIQELTASKLLLGFQDVLYEQDRDRSRVLMSYSSRNGEMSDVCEVWKRCLLFADRLFETISNASLDDTAALDLSFKFLSKYEYILYLPLMKSSEHRVSLGLITLSTLSARLFFKINTIFGGSTSITISGLLRRFSKDALDIVKDTIPLLGVGDVNEQGGFLASKVNLHGHLLAISKSEIYEEHNMKKKGVLKRRIGKLKKFSQVIGKMKNKKKDDSTVWQVGLLSARRGKKEEDMIYDDGEHYPMMHLLLEAEALLLESLVPVISFIRTLMPRFLFSIIQSIPNPTDFYSEGSSVVYHSKTHRDIFEGQIISMNKTVVGNIEYSIVTKNGTREYGIGTESILYPKEPLIEFFGVDIKLHGAMEHERMVQSLYGCSVSHLFFLLEYLMRSELDTKLTYAFPDWEGTRAVVNDLTYLSEQVITILVQTLAHHSVKVNYGLVESENLRKKIADLQDILEKVSKLGIRYGRGDSMGDVDSSPHATRGSFDTPHSKSLPPSAASGEVLHDFNGDEGFAEFISSTQKYLSRIHDAVQKRMNPLPDAGDINDFEDEGSMIGTYRGRSHSRTLSHGTDENQTPHSYAQSSAFFTKSPTIASKSPTTTNRPRTPGSSIRNKVEYLD